MSMLKANASMKHPTKTRVEEEQAGKVAKSKQEDTERRMVTWTDPWLFS